MKRPGSSQILHHIIFFLGLSLAVGNGHELPGSEGGSEDHFVMEKGQRQQHGVSALRHADGVGDSWTDVAASVVRIVACFLTMTVTTCLWALLMLLLFPWPHERIRQGNLYGHVTGRLMMWILGNPIEIEGAEFANTRAIYICNHASPLDIFLIMWLTPIGTVGIAKKEIICYPLFGQLYVLANHLRIDRSNPTAAIESIKEAAREIVKHKLSLIIFPEGTRSTTGRLLPFKKGFVHIALQSGLPIVPIVLTGTHRAWRKGSMRVRPANLAVRYLPPIETTDWRAENINEYVEMMHDLYARHLPKSQQPLVLGESVRHERRSRF